MLTELTCTVSCGGGLFELTSGITRQRSDAVVGCRGTDSPEHQASAAREVWPALQALPSLCLTAEPGFWDLHSTCFNNQVYAMQACWGLDMLRPYLSNWVLLL